MVTNKEDSADVVGAEATQKAAPASDNKRKKPHIPFPSIDQFCNVITRVKRHKGADGVLLPTMKFQGTVKLHGTNASVCYNNERGLWFQSRNTIITPESDNYGFARWANGLPSIWMQMVEELGAANEVSLDEGTITIFGEWCGKGIQKGVAISELDHMFVIFGACYTPFVGSAKADPLVALQASCAQGNETSAAGAPSESTEGHSDEEEELDRKQWLDYSYLKAPEARVFNILDFPTFEIMIDFNQPKLVQNYLGELTNAVEAECPVGKHFGVSGIGEGIVWCTPDSIHPYRFKVKGKKHSVSKVKTIANVDVEKIAGAVAFADYAATPQRFAQALNEVVKGQPLEMRQLGDVIRWVVGDITKEEGDALEQNGLVVKDVNKYISDRVKNMFIEEMSK